MKKIFGHYPALTFRDYRLVFFGNFLSQSGSQMQIVALNWQIYIITHSAVMLGLIGLTRFVPIVVFSLIGGSFADSFNRKKVMIACQLSMAFFTSILAFMTLRGSITPLFIFVLTAIVSSFLAFDTPARQAIIPSLVSKGAFQNAMSLNSIQFQTASILGPVIGGFLIGKTSVGSVYLLNALSFIIYAFMIFQMKNTGDSHIEEGEKTNVSLSHIAEGIRFITSKTIIWSTMLLDGLCTFFASAQSLLPIFATDILHVGAQGLGILYAADAIGSVGAGLIIARLGKLKNQGRILLVAVTFFALGTIIFGISKSFILSLIALVTLGAGDGTSTIIRNIVRQISTPDEMRGRMTSVNMIFVMGGPQLGEFESGLLAGLTGAPLSVVIGGIGTLIVVGLMAWKIPLLRNYKGESIEL